MAGPTASLKIRRKRSHRPPRLRRYLGITLRRAHGASRKRICRRERQAPVTRLRKCATARLQIRPVAGEFLGARPLRQARQSARLRLLAPRRLDHKVTSVDVATFLKASCARCAHAIPLGGSVEAGSQVRNQTFYKPQSRIDQLKRPRSSSLSCCIYMQHMATS